MASCLAYIWISYLGAGSAAACTRSADCATGTQKLSRFASRAAPGAVQVVHSPGDPRGSLFREDVAQRLSEDVSELAHLEAGGVDVAIRGDPDLGVSVHAVPECIPTIHRLGARSLGEGGRNDPSFALQRAPYRLLPD